MRRCVPPLIAALTSIVGSVAMFAILILVLRPGWVSHEYLGLAVWSVPPAIVVALAARVLGRPIAERSAIVRCAVATVTGAVIGVGWAFASYYLSAGWVLAFDAPVLYCWSFGAILGLLIVFLWPTLGQSYAQVDA